MPGRRLAVEQRLIEGDGGTDDALDLNAAGLERSELLVKAALALVSIAVDQSKGPVSP